MNCAYLDKFDQGAMDETEFRKHAVACPTCREALELDQDVMSLAKSLKQEIEAPRLWDRIEKSLAAEMTKKHRFSRRLFRLVPAMVALMLIVWLGISNILKNRAPSSGLMAKKALARVEQKEQDYLKAIQDLEKQALPKMAGMDLKLVFLYRDRLETIDAQIKQCQEALALNPANAHIRRYLMMALIDKKETLAEILDPENEKLKSRRST
jgi:hypothetical protein